jgi:hypothetical protein
MNSNRFTQLAKEPLARNLIPILASYQSSEKAVLAQADVSARKPLGQVSKTVTTLNNSALI